MDDGSIKMLHEALQPLLTNAVKDDQRSSWQQVFENINDNIAKLECEKQALIILANNNWYLESRLLSHAELLVSKIEAGDINFVDEYLIGLYRNMFNKDMFWMGEENFPDRKTIFDEIIFCVSNKKFHSAITMILTQIDGICNDIAENEFFIKSKKDGYIPNVSVAIKKPFLFELSHFFAPMMQSTSIAAREKDMGDSNQLNRHKIIHGKSLGFGTETNFYKCFSLFAYLLEVLGSYQTASDPDAIW